MAATPTWRRHPRARAVSGGFTYLSLIIFIAVIALVTAASLKLGSVLQRSRAEQELLDIGAAFSDALKSYADATPQGQLAQPPSLKELLKDPRFPGTRRHLRKIFVDPMTGKAEWGVVYLADKAGVLAVYSLSDARPVKVGNFPQRFAGFEGKSRISEWKFVAASDSRNTSQTSQPPANQASSAPPVVEPQQNPVVPSPPVQKTPEEPLIPPEEPAPPSENVPNQGAERRPDEPVTD
ncbi:type II secretion system protein [Duganella sp. CY15W]|uniref:type II secretion system protein n=1 Tax=Duganella sp. CY15W TaxID=2692172 RepID=UPI00136B9D04|nr:type II secretion system protein [Duganella sp. CY15W]MYM32494.1 type II secretion system protein [Duganella sp. CY15W]